MLPIKRPVEGVLVEEGESEKNAPGSPFIKKYRIDHFVQSTTANNSSSSRSEVGIFGKNSNNHSSIGGVSETLIMALGDANHTDIDEDFHSRKLAVYGRETMPRLFPSNVLISGVLGLGV